jgi:hypothetical protein
VWLTPRPKCSVDEAAVPYLRGSGTRPFLAILLISSYYDYAFRYPQRGCQVVPFHVYSGVKCSRRIGRNAYELETGDEVGQFPPDWRIHSVVSAQQLEPAPDPMKPDEFGRARPQNPDPIETSREHEIERIHKKRINKPGQPEYEVVWKEFGPEHNRWYRLDMLQNAKELVDESEKNLGGTEASASRSLEAQRNRHSSRKVSENRQRHAPKGV